MDRLKNRALLICTFAVVLVSPAIVLAGHNTQVQAIGYSAQGRYFAYEEFGLNENSQIAYSRIYIIDLIQISQVVGTPVTYRANIDEEPMTQVRKNARAEAAIFLESLRIDYPAVIVAIIGDGQLDVKHDTLVFGVPVSHSISEISGRNIITLRTFDAMSTLDCTEILDTPTMGFSLTLEHGENSEVIYKDNALPRSRECPFAYELNSIVLPFGATDASQAVGLISVYIQGNDRVERHYLAIPLMNNILDKN
jgi:hypothetical protein